MQYLHGDSMTTVENMFPYFVKTAEKNKFFSSRRSQIHQLENIDVANTRCTICHEQWSEGTPGQVEQT